MVSDFDPDRTPPDPLLASVQELPELPETPTWIPQQAEQIAKQAGLKEKQLPPRPVPPPPPPPHAHGAPGQKAAPGQRPAMAIAPPGGTLPEMARKTIMEEPAPGGLPPAVAAAPPRAAAQARPAAPATAPDEEEGEEEQADERVQIVAGPNARPKILRRRRGSKAAFSGPGHRATTLQKQIVKLGIGLVVLLAVLVGVAIFAMGSSDKPRARKKVPAAVEGTAE